MSDTTTTPAENGTPRELSAETLARLTHGAQAQASAEAARRTRATLIADARTPGSLAQILDFDHVVFINDEGQVTDGLSGIYAPDVLDPDSGSTSIDGAPRWELITAGLTGQHGYNGPWLHDSELIEGGVATRILEHAEAHGGGYYVAIYAQYSCDACGGAGMVCTDDEEVSCPEIEMGRCEPGSTTIEGWAIAYRAVNA